MKGVINGFFKDKSMFDIRNALNPRIGYDGESISKLFSIAKSVFNTLDERSQRRPPADPGKY